MKIRALLLLTVLLLYGCGGSSPAPPSESQAATESTRSGFVYLDGRPVPAQIVVLDAQGNVLQRAVASETGNFTLSNLPSGRLKVVATLADGTPLELTTELTDYLWVDILSHLTSLYAADHPDLSLAEARRAIHRGLSLKEDQPTNGMSSLAGSPFSARQFLDQAARNGGFTAYARTVVTQIEAGQTLDFGVPAEALALRLMRRQAAREHVQASDQAIVSVFHFIGIVSASDVVQLGTTNLLGFACSAVGLNIGTVGALNELKSTLDDLVNEVANLASLIQSDFAVLDYHDNLNVLNPVTADIDANMGRLQAIAEAGADSNPPPTTTFNRGPAAIPSQVSTFAQLIVETDAAAWTQLLLDYLVNTTLSQNQVVLYNQNFGNATYPLKDSNYAQHFYYSQRQDSWTSVLQSNLDSLRSYVVEACLLWCESAQLSVLPQTVDGFAPPAIPLNQARFGGGGGAESNSGTAHAQMVLLAAQNQVPAPLGTTQVLVDLTQNRMWYLSYMNGTQGPTWAGAQGTLTGNPMFQLLGWTAAPFPTDDQRHWNGTDSDPSYNRGPDGGWRFPTYKECSDLRNLARASGLKDLARLGFIIPSEHNDTMHLYGKPDVGTPDRYHGYDWSNGKEVVLERFGGGPNWDFMYVRNLPDFTSGDTAQIAHACYGFLPSRGLQILSVNQQNGQLDVLGNEEASSSNLTSRCLWTTSNPAVVDFIPSSNPDVINIEYHSSGSATVTATFQGASSQIGSNGAQPGKLQTVTTSITLQSPLSSSGDTLSSINVSPYNTFFQGKTPPAGTGDGFQQYYLTGFFQGDGATDLTNLATWVALDANGNKLDPSIGLFDNSFQRRGTLRFGPKQKFSPSQTITIQATYNNQKYTALLGW